MRSVLVVAMLCAACLLQGGESVRATPAAAGVDEQRVDFVVGNVVFVMLHELAHLLIDDYDIPVLGNGEDAADTLAAMSLIRLDRARPERDFAFVRMLISAADANRILWQRNIERDNLDAYLARHPLSVQRAARIACLAYGSEPERLADLPEIVGLPDFRAFWCEEEFADANRAWLWVRDAYVRKAASGSEDHGFVYGRARKPSHRIIRERLQSGRALERALEIISASVLLRDIITLEARACGAPEAYWDPDARDIVVCYELIEGFYTLASEQSVRELEARLRGLGGGD